MPTYVVSVERTAACPTAVVRARTTWPEFPTLWRTMLDEVWAFLRARPNLRTDGHNVMMYRHTGGGEVAVEVGVQVTGSFEPAARVVPSMLPAVEAATARAATIADLGAAHAAVQTWCSEHGRGLTGRSWEIYGDPDPQGTVEVTVFWEVGPGGQAPVGGAAQG